MTRRFWLTICPPDDTPPGTYRGAVTVTPQKGVAPRRAGRVPRVPGHARSRRRPRRARGGTKSGFLGTATTRPPATWNEAMTRRSLRQDAPVRAHHLLRAAADRAIGASRTASPRSTSATATSRCSASKRLGFKMPVVSYVRRGRPESVLQGRSGDAGRRVSTTTADSSGPCSPRSKSTPRGRAGCPCTATWATSRLATTCGARRRTPKRIAQPCIQGPPFFTAATSFTGDKPDDPHFRFAQGPARGRSEPAR